MMFISSRSQCVKICNSINDELIRNHQSYVPEIPKHLLRFFNHFVPINGDRFSVDINISYKGRIDVCSHLLRCDDISWAITRAPSFLLSIVYVMSITAE